jgi:hypothetical protein
MTGVVEVPFPCSIQYIEICLSSLWHLWIAMISNYTQAPGPTMQRLLESFSSALVIGLGIVVTSILWLKFDLFRTLDVVEINKPSIWEWSRARTASNYVTRTEELIRKGLKVRLYWFCNLSGNNNIFTACQGHSTAYRLRPPPRSGLVIYKRHQESQRS